MHNEIETITSSLIVNNFFLIVGAGEYGSKAFEFYSQKKDGLILIIDKSKEALESLNLNIIENFSEIENAIVSIENCDTNVGLVSMGFCSDISCIPFILSIAIPEKIIPVIPIHMLAQIFLMYRSLPIISSNGNTNNEKRISFEKSYLGNESPTKTLTNEIFDKILQQIPPDIILTFDTDIGIITLSYAKINEICPANCTGPAEYCPNFKRSKPLTITQICKNIALENIFGIVLESKQIIGGLGALDGCEFKKAVIKGLKCIYDKIQKEETKYSYLLYATTCNCHGVINLFKINP